MKIDLELSPAQKNLARWALVAAFSVGVIGLGVALAAPIETGWIASGEKVSSSALKKALDETEKRLAALESGATNAGHATNADNAADAGHATKADGVTGTIASSMLRVTSSCASPPDAPNAVDCSCASGEVAINGGGWCGTNAMIESASFPRGSAKWRIACLNGPPGNYYAMCLKVSP